MFIKIFTPNEDGKIELTVKQLETLLQEAADKAARERCSNCNKGYWYSSVTTTPNITLLNDKANSPSRSGEITWDWNQITCSDNSTNAVGDLSKFRSPINEQLEFDFDNIKEN